MNALLLYSDEVIENNRFILKGDRAKFILNHYTVIPKHPIKGIIPQFNRRVSLHFEKISPDEIIGVLTDREASYPRLSLTVLVAIPRPQTVKKILHLVTVLGFEELIFFPSSNGEKSYLSSSVLLPTGITDEINKGLSQADDSIIPIVKIVRTLKDAILVSDDKKNSYVANTISCASVNTINNNLPARIAIGAEKGWSSKELELLTYAKFTQVNLGSRILRSETALCVLGSRFLR
jgi:16S rRNA (uracil1498-N3)-methyltransferase